MPKARDLADLNTQLLAACRADEGREIAGHQQPVGALMIEERPQLLPARRTRLRAGGDGVSTGGWSRLRAGADGASLTTSAVTDGSNKCSTWNTISMYWSANRGL